MQRRKTLFVASLVLLMVIGFMATSLTSYFVARESLSNSISEQMLPLTSDNIYSEIQRDLLRPVLISSLMSTDTFVRDWVLDGENDPVRIRNYLREIQMRYQTITAFFISEKTRNYYHPDGIIKQVSEADPNDSWYFRVSRMNDPYEINVDADTVDRSRLSIFINYRVVGQQGEFLGVTGVGLSVEAVSSLIHNYQQRYNRNIFFVDRQGNLTLSGRDGETVDRLQSHPGLAPLATQILSSPSSNHSYTSEAGNTVYVNSRLVPEFNWYLLVEQDSSLAEQSITNTLVQNLLLSGTIMVLVLLIAHFTLKSYQQRLEEMATTDKLTGTNNRHMFDVIVSHIIKTSSRRGKQMSVLSIDIDHFKEVNDNYGHQAGDLVLGTVADVMRGQLRETDPIFRWGGEEFIVVLEDCTAEQAMKQAEKIRETIKALPITFGRDEIRVTLSAGITQYRTGEQLSQLIGRVDAALYRAKNQGRDQSCMAD